MKRLFIPIIALLLVATLFSCGRELPLSASGEIYTDTEGVYITLSEFYEGEGGRMLRVLWHNETERTVCFGLDYRVEYLRGGEWVNVCTEDYAIPEIACILDPESTTEQSYKLKYFNLSKPGKYRIFVNYYLQESPLGGDGGSGTAYAVFEALSE